jgi:undecaprenyl-diphosphatase
MQTLDWTILHAVNNLAGRSWLLDSAAVFLTNYAPALFGVGFLLLWVWPGAGRPRLRRAVLCAVLAGVLALALNAGIASVYNRQRPFAALPGQVHQLVAHGPNASFPSDHSSGSFAFAAAMTEGGPRVAMAFWMTGALVALSRLYVGVHWPTDLLGSLVVGLLSAWLIRAWRRPLEPLVQRILKRKALPPRK